MTEFEWWTFETAATMAEQVAEDVSFIIERAVEANGKAELCISGGSTPVPILKALALNKDIDWSKVSVTPTDERLVRSDDPLSNHRMIADIVAAKGATVNPLFDQSHDWTALEAGRSADARLAQLSWPIDLTWLGMGDDGHTASIFPSVMNAALDVPRGRRAVGLEPNPLPDNAPVARVTLTKPALLDAHTLIVVITGEAKKAVLERAIADGPSSTLPIGRVLADAEVPVDIYWSAE